MSRFYPVSKLIAPIFVDQQNFSGELSAPAESIRTIPGFSRLNRKQVFQKVETLLESGIGTVLLYPLLAPPMAGLPETPAPQVGSDFFMLPLVQEIKGRYPAVQIILDLCLCHFSPAGQCGVIEHQELANDPTLSALEKMAESFAASGADALMLSGMIDGAVATVRRALDKGGHSKTLLIVQSAKLDSSLYGPFQKMKKAPVRQDIKSTYQVDPANGRQALRELEQDIQEGADILVLKPILNSVDILARCDRHQRPPIFGYMTGGEYALLREQLADEPGLRLKQLNGWLCNLERAGLDAIFCYIAEEYAHLLSQYPRQTIG